MMTMTREREERRPHQIDTPIHWRQLFCQTLCGMQECNKHFRFKQIGKAVSMIALPRRCLYPKLDFIRLYSFESGDYLSWRISPLKEPIYPGAINKILYLGYWSSQCDPNQCMDITIVGRLR
eukprot:scaffold17715_cov30-Cyclotella_meneghiniana.AAC.2